MRTFSSDNAKNHSCKLVDAARIAPMAVTKYDKPFVVVMAVEKFERLKVLDLPGVPMGNLPVGKTGAARDKS
jgi:hypothetical protein